MPDLVQEANDQIMRKYWVVYYKDFLVCRGWKEMEGKDVWIRR
jgi:hypothetical protein